MRRRGELRRDVRRRPRGVPEGAAQAAREGRHGVGQQGPESRTSEGPTATCLITVTSGELGGRRARQGAVRAHVQVAHLALQQDARRAGPGTVLLDGYGVQDSGFLTDLVCSDSFIGVLDIAGFEIFDVRLPFRGCGILTFT